MTPPALRVLVLEDSPTDFELLEHELRRGFPSSEIERVDDPGGLGDALVKAWDIVISDWSMPKLSALESLEMLKRLDLDVPFIILSGTIGEEAAVEAMRSGAADYLLKGNLGRLVPVVEREVRERERRRQAKETLRSIEEQLRQAQKMEAVGQLAGGVAHDFNNLLSVILTYTDFLIGDALPSDPAVGDLQEIKKAGERAADLTRQLLAFSRQQMFEVKVIDLNAVIVRTDKMLRRLIGEDIELQTLPAPHLGRVTADEGQIEQVVLNLVVNARDAMPTGGKLTIETADVEIDEGYAGTHLGVTPGSYVMLSVSDTGFGMNRATQARIFEPFFTTKEKGKGTGLGLATVFGIVKQSGGDIWVYSELGKGTTFKIYLPRTSEQPTQNVGSQVELTTLSGTETILLVEDDEQVRSLVRTILRKFGYKVIEAQNAGEALLACERHGTPIHLLLTDVVMPHLSGPDLARRLAPLRPMMRVLFMSGYTDEAVFRHGIIAPGFAFLQKPITTERLTKKIREVLAVQQ